MKRSAFWEIMLYGSVKINGRFGGTCFLLAVCFMLVSCLAYFSALKMVTACPSEMSVDFHRTTYRHISEGRILYNQLTVKSETPN
jgi:hypothetical protein